MAEDQTATTAPKKTKKSTYDTISVESVPGVEITIMCARPIPDCYNEIISAGLVHKSADEATRRNAGLAGTMTIHRLSSTELAALKREQLEKQGMPKNLIVKALDRGGDFEKEKKAVWDAFLDSESASAGKELAGRRKKLEILLHNAGLYPDTLIWL